MRFLLSVLFLTVVLTFVVDPLMKKLVTFYKNKNNKLEEDEL